MNPISKSTPDKIGQFIPTLNQQGFKVKELGFCARPDYPDDVRLDGRENIGIICIKPNPLP
jgi:hypothetical protein